MGRRPEEWVELKHLLKDVQKSLGGLGKSLAHLFLLLKLGYRCDGSVHLFLVYQKAEVLILVDMNFLANFAHLIMLINFVILVLQA